MIAPCTPVWLGSAVWARLRPGLEGDDRAGRLGRRNDQPGDGAQDEADDDFVDEQAERRHHVLGLRRQRRRLTSG